MNYQGLIKNSTTFKNFEALVDKGRISHAYIIFSEDEEYNKQFCYFMAQKLMCKDMCNSCSDCVKIKNLVHPDLIVLPQGKSFVASDSNYIIEQVNVLPMMAERKVFVINNFHQATVQAQNKLLKTLEEPPKNVVFILNCTSLGTILPTVFSRTFKIEIERFSKNQLKEFLEGVEVSEMAFAEGNGLPGITLKFATDKGFNEDCNFIQTLMSEMKSSRDVLKFSSTFTKENLLSRLNLMENFFEKELVKVANGEQSEFTKEAISQIFEKINLAKKQLNANCGINLIVDMLLLGILEVKYLCKK